MNAKILTILAAMMLSSTAFASPSIIFNGVDITGVTDQKFTNVTVEFDSNGNIILTAPSSTLPAQIVGSNLPTPLPPPSIDTLPDTVKPTYIIATFDSPGLLGHNVDVYVNGQFVKTFYQGTAQQTYDISAFLHRGKNTIQYRMIMAADSGTSSRATVEFSLAKLTGKQGNAIELTGQYATLKINGIDGAKTYSVDVMVP